MRFIRHVDRIKAGNLATAAYVTRTVPVSRIVTFAAPASTLTNFPVLVKSNSTFNIATSTGYDVHFQDMSGNELSYELDYYDPVTGNGAWWVLIPSLSSSDTTSIKMIYGNKGASTDGSSPLTVWADYVAVYHFNEIDYEHQTNRALGTQSVSTFAQANSMSFQSATGGTGRVLRFTHKGGTEDKTQAIITPNVSLQSNSYSTIALWNKTSLDSSGSNGRWYTMFAPDMDGKNPYQSNASHFSYNRSGNKLYCDSGIYPINSSCNIATTSTTYGMFYFGVSYTEGSFRYTQINSSYTSGQAADYSAAYKWTANSTFLSMTEPWGGAVASEMDELRFCKTAHSLDWMNYEYENYVDHANNVAYGPENMPLYTRVEYLQSSGPNANSGGIHIDTEIPYYADFEIECMRTDNQPTKFAGTGAYDCLQRNGSEGLFYFSASNVTSYTSSASILQRTVCKWKDGKIYINGTQVSTLSKNPSATGNETFKLYGGQSVGGVGGYYTNIRIYYCKLWNPSDGTLVRDMYPVRRNTDNVYGFYDNVTNTFFPPVGDGSLIAGNDIS